jgi:sensor c-di-GMP phosphodiesterase-like protein
MISTSDPRSRRFGRLGAGPLTGARLIHVGSEERDERVRLRRLHDRAATRRERAARGEREAAEASDMFSDAEAAERHRDAARELEHGADDERHKANDER